MEFFRSKEIHRDLWVYGLLGAALAVGGFCVGLAAGCLCVGTALLLGGYHFWSTRQRYKRIALLSAELDRLLHNGASVDFARFDEGELSVLQNELQKLTTRLLEQSEKLRAEKTALADSIADISHQLKTPLTAFHLVLSFLREPALEPDRRVQLAQELEKLTGRVDWLIASLLKLSRLDAGVIQLKAEPTGLQGVAEAAVRPLLISMELQDQRLVTAFHGEGFVGDPGWTAEALGNLLKNCVEHTPPGGTISMEASENPLFTELRITDTGPGFDPQDLPRLFERFYKGRKDRDAGGQGAGIGLALARSILIRQDATIKAENALQGGARFVIRFYKGVV